MNIKYLRIASDLHLEQYRDRKIEKLVNDFIPGDNRDIESVLVLAGDISSLPEQLVRFIAEVENRFLKVIFVPGNHEYYHNKMTEWNESVDEVFKQNLTNTMGAFGNVQTALFDNAFFVFGTLWADGGINDCQHNAVQKGLYDFKIIDFNGVPFTVSDMCKLNTQMKVDISEALKNKPPVKSIVVTHHLPSHQLCHPRFGAALNGGFASNCGDILRVLKPDIWVFGHTHDTIDRRMLNTRFICNPRGYAKEFSNDQDNYNTFGPMFVEL